MIYQVVFDFLSNVPGTSHQTSHQLLLLLQLSDGQNITPMEPAVHQYSQEGFAESTQKSYGSAMNKFHTFCCKNAISSPFPVTEQFLFAA